LILASDGLYLNQLDAFAVSIVVIELTGKLASIPPPTKYLT